MPATGIYARKGSQAEVQLNTHRHYLSTSDCISIRVGQGVVERGIHAIIADTILVIDAIDELGDRTAIEIAGSKPKPPPVAPLSSLVSPDGVVRIDAFLVGQFEDGSLIVEIVGNLVNFPLGTQLQIPDFHRGGEVVATEHRARPRYGIDHTLIRVRTSIPLTAAYAVERVSVERIGVPSAGRIRLEINLAGTNG
jgi:hypothetical protein